MTTGNNRFGAMGPRMVRRMLATTALGSGVFLAGGSAMAADSAPRVGMEEIIVTATKRSLRLQDVAMSISAISGRDLLLAGDDDFADYLRKIPGIVMVDQGPGRNKMIIRGVSDGPNATTAATTGVYIDETPVTNTRFNPDLKTFDVERVEVLRGPQGTLYGAGSMGGTVRIVLNKPDATQTEAAVDLTASSTRRGSENYAVNAMLNLPLVQDELAIRGVVYHRDESGFIDDPVSGRKNVNDEETTGGRFLMRWQASDALLIDASITHQQTELGAFTQDDLALGKFQQSRVIQERQDDEWTLYNLTFQYDLDWADMLLSTSYFDRSFEEDQDVSPLITGAFGLPTVFPSALNNTYDYSEYNTELRLVSKTPGPFQWIAGVFYSNRKLDRGQYVDATGFPLPFGDFLLRIGIDNKVEQVAGFGEASYDLTDRLKATVGLRWSSTNGDDSISREGVIAGVLPGGAPDVQLSDFSEDFVNPKFLLSYQASDDVLVYAEAAQGFRIGGPNVAVPTNVCGADLAALGLTSAPTSFDSDSLWNYELGAKTTFADKRVTLNSSLFYIDWSDIQINRTLACGFGFIDNAGKSSSKGIEAELTVVPVDALELTAGVAYTDAELERNAPSVGAVKGDPVPNIPKWTVNLTAHYSFPVSDTLNAYIRGEYSYNSGSLNDFAGLGPAVSVDQPGYDIGNLRIGVQAESWEVAVFADNIWDTRAQTYTLLNFFNPHQVVNRPRTIGINLKGWF